MAAAPTSLSLHDADGPWVSPSLEVACSSPHAGAVLSCEVPWWVSRVGVEAAFSDGRKRSSLLHTERSTSANRALPSLPVAVGQTSMWVDVAASSEPSGLAAGGALQLAVLRKEPLALVLRAVPSYAAGQLSLISFLSGLLAVRWLDVPLYYAAPLLAAIPLGRVCPELPRLLPSLLSSGDVHSGRHRLYVLRIVLVCLLAIVLLLLLLTPGPPATAGPKREPPPPPTPSRVEPPAANCQELGGIDCTHQLLPQWTESTGECTVLVETNGTCQSFCASRGWRCRRGMDDSGNGSCSVATGGHQRQVGEEDGCLQNWRTQICLCSIRPDVPAAAEEAKPPGALEDARGREVPRHTAPDYKDAAPVDAPAAEQPEPMEPCFFRHGLYLPLNMPGQGRWVASSALACQHRCARTPGCAHFTWWPDGGCHLQEFRASLAFGPGGAVAGPSSCDDERELRELRRDDERELRRPTPTEPPAPGRHPPPPSPARPHPEAPRAPVCAEGSPSLVLALFLTFLWIAASS